MSKKQSKEEMKRLNGFYLTDLERASGRIAHAEEIAENSLLAGNNDYAGIYIDIAKEASKKYGLPCKYA